MKLADLRDMTDEELIERHDSKTGYDFTQEFCRNELARRDQNRQTKAMLRYTRCIIWLTVVTTIATIINLICIFKK